MEGRGERVDERKEGRKEDLSDDPVELMGAVEDRKPSATQCAEYTAEHNKRWLIDKRPFQVRQPTTLESSISAIGEDLAGFHTYISRCNLHQLEHDSREPVLKILIMKIVYYNQRIRVPEDSVFGGLGNGLQLPLTRGIQIPHWLVISVENIEEALRKRLQNQILNYQWIGSQDSEPVEKRTHPTSSTRRFGPEVDGAGSLGGTSREENSGKKKAESGNSLPSREQHVMAHRLFVLLGTKRPAGQRATLVLTADGMNGEQDTGKVTAEPCQDRMSGQTDSLKSFLAVSGFSSL
ncbi:hypothetical protein STEG23_031477 [Scotinomys teguina]